MLLFLSFPAVAATPSSRPVAPLPHVYSKDELVSMVIKEADENDLNSDHMVAVISCETAHTWNPKIQSGAHNKADGGRELSFGLAQIHLPAHPTITKEQATDPAFAIHYMATEWKKGNAGAWSCTHIERAKGWEKSSA